MSNNRFTLIFALFVCSGLLALGCNLVDPDPFEPDVVVESYQIAGERLQPVRLSWSAAIDEAYDPEKHAIRGANVIVELLDEDGDVETSYPFIEAHEAPGLYVTRNRTRVRPLHTYRLRVQLPAADHELLAETVVPDTFSVLEVTADTLTYQADRAQITISKSDYPGRQAVYVFSTISEDPSEENLTPFYRSLFDASDENVTLKDLQVTSSGALNEANFVVDELGNIRLDFPWLAVAFYGPNVVSVAAIDDNYYDFIRSQQAQQGGFGFSPGEIPNIITNVTGGSGLFGSFARQTLDLYVQH